MAWTTRAESGEGTTATLNGAINPRGIPTVYHFQYGLTRAYGTIATGARSGYTKNKRYAVEAPVFGLRPATAYHFRIVAVSRGGKTYGDDKTFMTLKPRIAKPGILIACFHPGISRFTARVHPSRCSIWGYRGKQFEGIPIKGMRWGKNWGANPTQAAYGVDTRTGTRVRVTAYRPVTCDEGRTWYSRVVIVTPGNGNNFGLRLLTCDGPSVIGHHGPDRARPDHAIDVLGAQKGESIDLLGGRELGANSPRRRGTHRPVASVDHQASRIVLRG
jgi:hypothetical protein